MLWYPVFAGFYRNIFVYTKQNPNVTFMHLSNTKYIAVDRLTWYVKQSTSMHVLDK